jgi:hypothetical protein
MHIGTLFQILNQVRIMHWQTDSHAAHKALGKFYEGFDALVDEFVETYSGKYGNPKIDSPIEITLVDINRIDPESYLGEVSQFIHGKFSEKINGEKDSDLANLRDEMLALANKTRYLLRLK